MKLLIVESPTKARRIYGMLKTVNTDNTWRVVVANGSVVGLPEKDLAVDIQNDFEPEWEIQDEKTAKLIMGLAAKADAVYFAMDNDLEGEAAAQHIRRLITETTFDGDMFRVRFNQVTKDTVLEAIENPALFDSLLFESYVARRVFDRLVGYVGSPILWRQLGPSLSIGRVQICVLALLSDRLLHRWYYQPKTRWLVEAETSGGTVLRSPVFQKKRNAISLLSHMRKRRWKVQLETGDPYAIGPPARLTTAWLISGANNLFGYTASHTMDLAQLLYENGKITYHHTDTIGYPVEFSRTVWRYLETEFEEKLPVEIQSHITDAGLEAIRPTSIEITPSNKTVPQKARDIYRLIWRYTLAAHANDAEVKNQRAFIDVGKVTLEAEGVEVLVSGYLSFVDSPGPMLEQLKVTDVRMVDAATEPEHHWTDASLVQHMDSLGIGRSFTYASTIEYLLKRGYAKRVGKYIIATLRGSLVAKFVRNSVPQITDAEYTSRAETRLDHIAKRRSAASRMSVMTSFWDELAPQFEHMKNCWLLCYDPCLKCGAELEVTFPKRGEPYLYCNEKRKAWENDGRFPGLPPVVPGCGSSYSMWLNADGAPIRFEPFELDDETVCKNCGSKESTVRSSKRGLYVYCRSCAEKWDYVR